ncbi:MAG: type II toxin-antitoxin system RelE/ParE family toxin [Chloroflexi bacterium]|nr:type II toxin-antitoxin system RelE/ParE family toxin [Chloroflexota bacterium]OJW05332.1 MAG: hypothetical protein BGO39_33535 [Chloroflexi bacterium 54-19]
MPNPPDVVVRFNKKAQNDISEITEYYLSLAGPEVARKNVRQILLKCRWLAENPMIGDQIAGFDEKSGSGIPCTKGTRFIFGVQPGTIFGYYEFEETVKSR